MALWRRFLCLLGPGVVYVAVARSRRFALCKGVKRPTIQGNLDIFIMSRLGRLLGYWVDSWRYIGLSRYPNLVMVFWFSKIWFPADFPVNPGNEPNEQQLKICLDYKGLDWIYFVGECGKGTRMIAIYSYLGVPQVWTMPNEAQCVYTCVEQTMMICVKNINKWFDLCKTSTTGYKHDCTAWHIQRVEDSDEVGHPWCLEQHTSFMDWLVNSWLKPSWKSC